MKTATAGWTLGFPWYPQIIPNPMGYQMFPDDWHFVVCSMVQTKLRQHFTAALITWHHPHLMIFCKDKNGSTRHPQYCWHSNEMKIVQPTQDIFVLLVSWQHVAVFFPNNADRIQQANLSIEWVRPFPKNTPPELCSPSFQAINEMAISNPTLDSQGPMIGWLYWIMSDICMIYGSILFYILILNWISLSCSKDF